MALGCVARVCASPERLEALRAAEGVDEVVRLVEAGVSEAEGPEETAVPEGSLLTIVELAPGMTPDGALVEALRRSFGTVATLGGQGDAVHRLLEGAAQVRRGSALVLVDVPQERMEGLKVLLEEYGRFHTDHPVAHVLRLIPEGEVVSARRVG
jgi:hypothetical protein